MLQSLSLLLLIGLASGDADPFARKETLVRVRDAGGRNLGLISFTAPSPTLNNTRSVFISPDGRRLEVHGFKHHDRYETIYFAPATKALLESVQRMDSLDDDALHVPHTLTIESETLYFSVPCSDRVRAKELPALRKELSTWLKLRASAFAPLLEQAYGVFSLVRRQDRPPALPHLSTRGLGELYDAYEEPPLQPLELDLRPPDEASKILPISGENAPRIGYSKSDPVPFRARLMSARDETVADVELRIQPLVFAGPRPLAAVHVEFSRGPMRRERAEIALVGPAGEYYVNLRQRVGPDWRTIAVIWGISGGKGPSWYEPYVLHGTEPQTLSFEVPPAGEDERRAARRRVADAIVALTVKSGMPERDREGFLWRWNRIFSQPEIRDAIPELESVLAVLSELPPPDFESEPARAWLGALRLSVEPK